MASLFAQKFPSRPHESLLPVFESDDQTTAPATTPSSTTVNVIRCMVAGLLIIVTILLSSPTLIFSVLHPQIPIVQLDFLSISNLNVSETQISAQWAANITATNPDKRFTVVLEAAKISVFYKGFINNSLSEFSTKGVTLETNQDATINAEGGIGKDGLGNKNLPYNEIAEAKKSGKMNFEVEMKVVAIQMAFSVWDKRIGLRFSCHDVPVDFFPDGGAGKSIFYRGFPCSLSETQQSNVSSLYILR